VPWDGCTVSIDPQTHAVTGKASMVALLQLPWHQALVAWLRANGKRIIGNCPVETRTMLGLQIPVFVETGFSYSCAIQTHLGSPWAYGNYPARDPARGTIYNAAYNLRRLLGYGSILAQPSWSDEPNGLTFLHLLFPFTPIEIRPGVLIGVERIITCRSGRFGWADASTAETHVFDGDGERVETPHVTALRAGDCVLTEVRLPSDHFAILARRQAVPSP
jgi:hypothetical protein